MDLFEHQQHDDLTKDTIIYALHGVKQLDDFLEEAFEQARNIVTIISPWLKYR